MSLRNWPGLGRSWFVCLSAVLISALRYGRCDSETSGSAGLGVLAQGGGAPRGHMQPLGSHQPEEGHVHTIPGFMKPATFFENHLNPGLPVLFKGAAKTLLAFERWDDTYLINEEPPGHIIYDILYISGTSLQRPPAKVVLREVVSLEREKYGHLQVEVETGKKETRQNYSDPTPFRDFLAEYSSRDVYMVQDALPEMYGDLGLPRPIQCGGSQHMLQSIVLWFSSGGTKSVLHLDDVENINCLLAGTKNLVLIDREYYDIVEADGFSGGYSRMDVEKVDMYKFPEMRHVPWWRAHMEEGDCLYIPLGWYHHVDSPAGQRNFAVNFWFYHSLSFNRTDCDSAGPLNDFGPLTEAAFLLDEREELGRFSLFYGLTHLDEVMLNDLEEGWGHILEDYEIKHVFEKFDTDRDNVLSWEEIQAADVVWMFEQYSLDDEDFREEDDGDEYYDPYDLDPDDILMRDEL